jgi:hypothetical protein
MVYAHTELWPQPHPKVDGYFSAVEDTDVDDHMNAMDAEGWELVSANTVLVPIGKEELRVGHFVHSFYWRRTI